MEQKNEIVLGNLSIKRPIPSFIQNMSVRQPLADIEKAHVKAHAIKSKSGKMSNVKDYDDKRKKKYENNFLKMSDEEIHEFHVRASEERNEKRSKLKTFNPAIKDLWNGAEDLPDGSKPLYGLRGAPKDWPENLSTYKSTVEVVAEKSGVIIHGEKVTLLKKEKTTKSILELAKKVQNGKDVISFKKLKQMGFKKVAI